MSTKRMHRILATVVATLLAGSSAALAQTAPPAPGQPPAVGAPAPSAMPGPQKVEGTVKSVNKEKESITLEDGTMLTFAPSAKTALAALKEGEKISATVVEKDGEKVVTSLRVEKPSKS